MKTNPNENKMTLFYLIQSNLYTNCELHDSRHGLDWDYEGLDRNGYLRRQKVNPAVARHDLHGISPSIMGCTVLYLQYLYHHSIDAVFINPVIIVNPVLKYIKSYFPQNKTTEILKT